MKKFAVLVAAAALAVGAQAATISGGSFSNGLATTDINQTGSLGLFDSTLGTLTGVSLTLNGAIETNISLTSTAAQQNRFSGTTTVDLFWSSSLAPVATALSAVDLQIVKGTGFQLLNPGDTYASGPLSQSGSFTPDVSAALASFIGTGNFDVTCSSFTQFSAGGGGGNVQSTQATSAGCGASIVYTYDAAPPPPPPAVPEPASLALVGLALAGLAASRKSRKA